MKPSKDFKVEWGNKCFLCFGSGKITIHDRAGEILPLERECGRCGGSGILGRLP